MFTTLSATPDWYKDLMTLIPDGKIFNLRAVFDGLPQIITKLPVTIGLTLGGAAFGLLLGLLFAIVKINKVPVIYRLQALFVSFLRGTPILVQLMLTYYGIPLALKAINARFGTSFNINDLPAYLFVVVAFAFNEAAYASETLRAAIQSVDSGEIEAAKSLGMTNTQVYSRVIIPNAAVVATPTLINNLIGLTKGTSLAFSAGIVEIYAQAQIMGGRDYRYFERFISVAIVYWIVNILIEQFGRFVERKMAIQSPEVQDLNQKFQAQGGDR
ncbi:amino acid ABC transporter permease [Streptococcus merionis]|uniref:amino acid ABC transporter permease n=1 Tax=Streptococcus merionis TaxID=400065 RepID=UPI0026EF9F7E|nr:amino acid ABC transporter permease [Streptococcus merionis]